MSSLSFNGTSDYARATAAVTSFPYSMVFWFYPTSTAANRTIGGLFNSGSTTIRSACIVLNTTGVLRMSCADAGGNTSTDTTNAVNLNAWNFAAITFTNATTRTVMLNGDTGNAGGGTVTSRTPASLDRFSIGVQDNSTQAAFGLGNIWMSALWSATLTNEEIVALSKGFPIKAIRVQSLAQCIPYPGAGGQDRYGRNFTVSGATASTNAPSVRHPFS